MRKTTFLRRITLPTFQGKRHPLHSRHAVAAFYQGEPRQQYGRSLTFNTQAHNSTGKCPRQENHKHRPLAPLLKKCIRNARR